jgi:phasin family protein
MFGQFTEQMKKSSQPASDLFAANVKALEAVSQQQTQFLSGVLDDSVKLLQTMSQQTEVKGLLAAQSVYAESLRERLTSTSKTTYGTMNNVSQQFADALKTGLESAGEASKAAVSKFQTVPVAAAPVKKAEAPKSKPAAKKTAAAKKPQR